MLHNLIFSVKGMYYNALGGKGKEFGWMERKMNVSIPATQLVLTG
jgi:hypothetical protein